VRVVKPGGLVLLTVPFGPSFKEHYGHFGVYERKYHGTPVFISRTYDIARFKDLLRAVDQTAALEELLGIGEIIPYSKLFDRLHENVRGALGPLSLPVALLNYEIVQMNADFRQFYLQGSSAFLLPLENSDARMTVGPTFGKLHYQLYKLFPFLEKRASLVLSLPPDPVLVDVGSSFGRT